MTKDRSKPAIKDLSSKPTFLQVLGVNVDTNMTNLQQMPGGRYQHSVTIINTRLDTSGQYRCQITEAQAPFHTEQQDRNLSVISKSNYHPDYRVGANRDFETNMNTNTTCFQKMKQIWIRILFVLFRKLFEYIRIFQIIRI